MSKHTPGPWTSDCPFIVAEYRGREIYIAEIAQTDDEGKIAPESQQLDNCQLLAQAPELEAIRKKLVTAFDKADKALLKKLFPGLHAQLVKAKDFGPDETKEED